MKVSEKEKEKSQLGSCDRMLETLNCLKAYRKLHGDKKDSPINNGSFVKEGSVYHESITASRTNLKQRGVMASGKRHFTTN